MTVQLVIELSDEVLKALVSSKNMTITVTHGGKGGGAGTVTPFGRKLIARYETMERSARRAIARDLHWVERAVAPPSAGRPSS